MRILMTGHQGRIGSHLTPELLEAGFDVRGFDRKSGAELTEPGHLYGAIRSFEPEVIIHLAAQTSVQYSIVETMKDFDDNVVGTTLLLDKAFMAQVPKVIIAASAGTAYDIKSAYGLSKKVAADYAALYRDVYEMDIVTLGLSNVYGPGMGGVVHEFIMAERQSRPDMQNPPGCVIYGDGLQTRDFIFIDDVVDAFRAALGWKPGYYEVATGRLESIFNVFRLMTYEWGYTPKLVYRDALPGEVKDSPSLKCDLPWTPKPLEEGLKVTVAHG